MQSRWKYTNNAEKEIRVDSMDSWKYTMDSL